MADSAERSETPSPPPPSPPPFYESSPDSSAHETVDESPICEKRRESLRSASAASETNFDEKSDLEIPRELVDAWKGFVTLDFKAPQLRNEEDDGKTLEYAVEVIWEVWSTFGP
jgi:hypothetical protein